MNLLLEFEKAISLEEYLETLGDQKSLYELHYKKATVSSRLNNFSNIKILIITESWCSDSTAMIPVLQKIFLDRDAEIRISVRDENPELMDNFLTNGKRAIPIVIVLNSSGELLLRYGPRPEAVQNIFEAHRDDIEKGRIEKKEVSRKIRNFYAKDRGQVISKTFIEALNEKLPLQESSLSLN